MRRCGLSPRGGGGGEPASFRGEGEEEEGWRKRARSWVEEEGSGEGEEEEEEEGRRGDVSEERPFPLSLDRERENMGDGVRGRKEGKKEGGRSDRARWNSFGRSRVASLFSQKISFSEAEKSQDTRKMIDAMQVRAIDKN